MKKIFRGQVILSAVYTVTAIVVFLYTLVFMTEYNDLFGLKMPQNKQIAQFYEVILQGFNRQILVWAIVGIIGILMIVLLEIRTAVPDRFAAAVMTVYMGCCCFGAVNAIRKADTLIVGGTSLAVYPAAGLIRYFRGRHLVVINMQPTGADAQADLCIAKPIGQVLSEDVLLED